MATKKKKDEIVVKHDFEKAKKELQKFSNSTSTPKELSKVDTDGGLFGWFSHKVTGSELNLLTSEIQEYLISFNKLHIKIIKEFGQVYNAFEALDKDYIKAIQVNMEAIFKTNTELKDAQSDIKGVIDIQKKTLEMLKKFKEKLEKYKHLGDVDEIWSSLKETEKQISGYTKTLNGIENYVKTLKAIKHLNNVDELWETSKATDKNIDELLKSIKLLQEQIGKHNGMLLEISGYIERLQKLSHLDSIDKMWEEQKKSIKTLDEIKKSVNKISKIDHLFDIDSLWSDVEIIKTQGVSLIEKQEEIENYINEHSALLKELKDFNDVIAKNEHLKDIDELWNMYDSTKNQLAECLSELDEMRNSKVQLEKAIENQQISFNKKLNIAYAVAGGSAFLMIIEVILHFVGVI